MKSPERTTAKWVNGAWVWVDPAQSNEPNKRVPYEQMSSVGRYMSDKGRKGQSGDDDAEHRRLERALSMKKIESYFCAPNQPIRYLVHLLICYGSSVLLLWAVHHSGAGRTGEALICPFLIMAHLAGMNAFNRCAKWLLEEKMAGFLTVAFVFNWPILLFWFVTGRVPGFGYS